MRFASCANPARVAGAAVLSYVRYSPTVEQIEDDESRTIAELIETLRSISDTTYRDTGQPLRSVHAKAHGLLKVEVKIASGLPPELAQGLFAQPGRYTGYLRFSTIPGDILDDSVSVPRGAALKILRVPGDRLPGSEGDTTQDFVLVNGPAFSASSAKAFLKNLKLLTKTTDKAESLKKVLSAAMRGVETVLEAVGTSSATVKTLGGQPETEILGDTFFSQAALRHGDYIAKIALAPVSPKLIASTDRSLDLSAHPNALRESVREFFGRSGGEWELRAQLCTNPETMPVEDASKIWPEDQSPYRAVAHIRAVPQDSWSEANVSHVDGGMAFSPWHGLAAHRPLGSVMRVRKDTYRMSADLRGRRSGCPMNEPIE